MRNFWSDLSFYLLAGFFCVLPVFMVAFATLRYGIIRFQPRQLHPKRWAALMAIVATPLLCWAGFYAVLFMYSYYPHRSFNPSRWELAPEKRYEMVDELQDSRRLIGFSPKQVAKLLGPPDYSHDTIWEYHLGIPPGFAIDGDDLTLEFRNNKIVRTSTHQN